MTLAPLAAAKLPHLLASSNKNNNNNNNPHPTPSPSPSLHPPQPPQPTRRPSTPNLQTRTLPPHPSLYLIHGFRWPRAAIRIHVILHNILDAAPDYTMSLSSNAAITSSLRAAHAKLFEGGSLDGLRMVEEYDPDDDGSGSAGAGGTVMEGAWVADKVVRLFPGVGGGGSNGRPSTRGEGAGAGAAALVDVKKIMDLGVRSETWDAMADLRDEVAKGEMLGWWVVWNGDPERGDLGVQGSGRDWGADGGIRTACEVADEDSAKKNKSGVKKWWRKGMKTQGPGLEA